MSSPEPATISQPALSPPPGASPPMNILLQSQPVDAYVNPITGEVVNGTVDSATGLQGSWTPAISAINFSKQLLKVQKQLEKMQTKGLDGTDRITSLMESGQKKLDSTQARLDKLNAKYTAANAKKAPNAAALAKQQKALAKITGQIKDLKNNLTVENALLLSPNYKQTFADYAKGVQAGYRSPIGSDPSQLVQFKSNDINNEYQIRGRDILRIDLTNNPDPQASQNAALTPAAKKPGGAAAAATATSNSNPPGVPANHDKPKHQGGPKK